MCVDGKRHTHLSDGEAEVLDGSDARVGIEHLDLSLIAEVDLGLIVHLACNFTSDTDTSRAHLEATGVVLRLLFILATQRTMNLRTIIDRVLSRSDDTETKG